jgi:gluconate 2-dehydrogenase subunit 3-like protein
MPQKSISRRDILKSLTITAAAGPILRSIPLQAAEFAHKIIQSEKSSSQSGAYAPKFFDAHQYKTLQQLCDMIIPADDHSAGALEAGAPEFIDLLTSENDDYQLKLGGGIRWLDSTCANRFGAAFLAATPDQQNQILDLIAYKKNAEPDASLTQAVEFFAFLRNLTADGFFTSAIGIEYLGYIGNTYLAEFPGCPPVPEA